MATIGIDSSTGLGAVSETNATAQALMNDTDYDYQAGANEQVFEVGFYCGTNVGDGAGVQIGVYDVTSGFATASLIASGTIASPSANALNTVGITPVALTNGNLYAIAKRIISATNVSMFRTFETNSCRNGSLTGTSALPSTWSDAGTQLSQRYAIFAHTQSSAASLSSPTGTAGNNGTTATGTVDTDTASGTLYIYTSTSATPPSGTDLKNGTGAAYATSQAISSTGTKTFNAISGLSISTTYYNHYLHNASGSDSAIVTSAAFVMKNPGFTTPAIYLPNTDDVAASLSSLTLVVRTAFDAATAPTYSTTTETTDGGGVMTFASTALSVGTAYKGVIWRNNGGEDEGLAFSFTAIDLDV